MIEIKYLLFIELGQDEIFIKSYKVRNSIYSWLLIKNPFYNKIIVDYSYVFHIHNSIG